MSEINVNFYKLQDISDRPNENGAISFGIDSEHGKGRLYISEGDGKDHLIGESLEQLSVGENNSLIGPINIAFGEGSIAGSKGWYFTTLDKDSVVALDDGRTIGYYTFTLSPKQTESYCTDEELSTILGLIEQDIADGGCYAVINEATIKDLYKIESAEQITNAETNISKIKLGLISTTSNTKLFSESGLQLHEIGERSDIFDNTLLLMSHPDAGVVELGPYSFAGLEGGRALSRSSTAFGIDNISYGQYAFSAGMSNRTGYCSASFGQFNWLTGGSCLSAGTNNKLKGNGGFAQGNGNTINNNMSAAFGNGNTVSGYAAVAMGEQNINRGNDSLVVGFSNDSSAATSLVSGTGNTASAAGKCSIISGDKNTVLAEHNIVGGHSNSVSGKDNLVAGTSNTITSSDCSIVAGNLNTIASGAHSSVAFGQNNSIAKKYSFSMGDSNTLTDTGATAIGNLHKVNGWYATALGYSNEVSAPCSLAIGSTNKITETVVNAATCTFVGGTKNTVNSCGPASIIVGEEIFVSGVHDSTNISQNGKQAIFGFRHQVYNGRGNLIAGKDHTINYAQTSLIVGRNHVVSGTSTNYLNDSLIAGNSTTVDTSKGTVNDSLAIGYTNTIASSHSAVIGHSSLVSGYCSQAFGQGLKATGHNQFVCGLFNEETNSAFVVGSGGSDASRTNAFEVSHGGHAKIKTSIQIGNTVLTEAQLVKIINLIDAIED
jgi:hypothetical protein